MAGSGFTGTREEFERLRKQEGIALGNAKDIDAYNEAQATLQSTDQGQAANARRMEAQDTINSITAKGLRNRANFDRRQSVRDQQESAARAEADRRAGLAASWKNNPAKSWDEAADRYNQLNITTSQSDWIAESKRNRAEADAKANEVRTRHNGWSSKAIAALNIYDKNPGDKGADAALSTAFTQIGNDFGKENGIAFQGFTKDTVNGESVVTMTWKREDGEEVSKKFSASQLMGAYKNDKEKADIAMGVVSQILDYSGNPVNKMTPDQQANVRKILSEAGLNEAKALESIAKAKQISEGGTGDVPSGSGSSSSGSSSGAQSGGSWGGFKDAGARESAKLSYKDWLMKNGLANDAADAEAKTEKYFAENYPIEQKTPVGVTGSNQNGTVPGVDDLLPGAQPDGAAERPAAPADPTAVEAAATPAKQTAAVPPVAVQANAETPEEGGAATDNASAASYSTQAQEISSAVEEASRPLSFDEVRDKTPTRGREYVTQTTVDSTNASRKSNAKAAFDRIDNSVRKAEPVGDGTFKVPKAGDELEAKIYNSLGLVPDKYATKAQIDKAIAILNEVKTGPKASSSPSPDPTSAAGSESGASAAEDVTPAAEAASEEEAVKTASTEPKASTAAPTMAEIEEMRVRRESANADANKKTKEAEARNQARMKSVERDDDFAKQYGRTPAELKNEIFEVLYNGSDLLAPLNQETVDAQLQKPSVRELLGLGYNTREGNKAFNDRQFGLQERQLADIERAGENVILQPALRDDGSEIPGIKKIVLNKVNKRTALHNGKVFEIETKNGEKERDRLEDLIAPAMLGGDAGYQETDDAYVFWVNEDLFNDLHNLQKERHQKWWDSQPENRGNTLKERKSARGRQALRRQVVESGK